jgi:hypothetical protein
MWECCNVCEHNYLLSMVLYHFFSLPIYLSIYQFFKIIMKEGALQEIVYDMNWLLIVKVHNHNHPNIPYFPAYKMHFFPRKM